MDSDDANVDSTAPAKRSRDDVDFGDVNEDSVEVKIILLLALANSMAVFIFSAFFRQEVFKNFTMHFSNLIHKTLLMLAL